MHATELPAALAPDPKAAMIAEMIALTERGEKVLALTRCQEALPGGWPWLEAELDRRIARLLDDAGA